MSTLLRASKDAALALENLSVEACGPLREYGLIVLRDLVAAIQAAEGEDEGRTPRSTPTRPHLWIVR